MELQDPPDPRREALDQSCATRWSDASPRAHPTTGTTPPGSSWRCWPPTRTWPHKPSADALAAMRELWEPETTARNLRLIREARERRGEPAAWIAEVEAELNKRATTVT